MSVERRVFREVSPGAGAGAEVGFDILNIELK